jgi:hypothetical protein
MQAIPIYGFGDYPDAKLLGKANQIIKAMTGNPNFPDSTPFLTPVQTATDEFKAAMIAAMDGGKTKNAIKKMKRKVLAAALKDLALYVQLNSKGDLAILLTSGYDARRKNTPVEAPGAPINFYVKNGESTGVMILSVKRHKNAWSYVFDYALVPESGDPYWTSVPSGRTLILRNLTPGKQYMFRAAIKGNRQELAYSQIVYKYVV